MFGVLVIFRHFGLKICIFFNAHVFFIVFYCYYVLLFYIIYWLRERIRTQVFAEYNCAESKERTNREVLFAYLELHRSNDNIYIV